MVQNKGMGKVLMFPAVGRTSFPGPVLGVRRDVVFLRGVDWELAVEPWRMGDVLEHLKLIRDGKAPLFLPVSQRELLGLIESLEELMRLEVN